MSAVGITENAKGDNKKFEIWCNSRDEVFIVQVRFSFSRASGTCWESSDDIQIYLVIILDLKSVAPTRLRPQRLNQPG